MENDIIYIFGKHSNKIPILLESVKNFVQLITLEPAGDMIKNGYRATYMDHRKLHLR